jgi:DNA-binding transcriptional ArsR family regulator
MPVGRKARRTILESFETRMRILSALIERGEPMTSKEINEETGIGHYPTINYHLGQLIKEGVVIPLNGEERRYTVQPFMLERAVDEKLQEAVNEAFDNTYIDHFVVNPERDDMELRIEAFGNAFLYYIKYLLETGRFKTHF